MCKWKRKKAPHVQTTFGSCDVEKVHAVVARSTFRSQNVQNTPCSDHFWKLRCDLVSRGRRKGLCTFSNVSKTWGFCGISKNDGRRGTFEEDLQRCIFCGNCSTKDMFMRDVRRSGRWFPERGCILEHQICRFAKILRWFCVTGAALRMTWHQLFVAALVRGCQRCTQLSIFEGSVAELLCFWCCQVWKMKESRRIASFLKLLSSNMKEVSQNCFVFDVVNFKKGGGLAELLSVWCGQLHKMRKSRRSAAFLMLSTWKNEDVS